MKKIWFVLIFAAAGSLCGQVTSSKWVSVYNESDQTVYVDTSNIKLIDNQISTLCLTVYSNPQLISSINKEASSIKSQVLFNLITRKYTVIGNLYYDPKSKIVGESSLKAVRNETFAVSIDSNHVMKSVYDKCMEFLNLGEVSIGTVPNNSAEAKREIPAPLLKTEISKKDDVKVQLHEEPVIPKPEEKETVQNSKPVLDNNKRQDDYNISNEKNPRGTIFTDGEKFCFQISSWQNKAKAENEVARLKRLGHNAFIAEVYLSGKGGTWYRVRIGYFNSLEETENYIRNSNL